MENLEDFFSNKSIKKINFQENLFIEIKNLIPFNTDTFEGTIAFSKNNEKNIQLIETVNNKRIFYKFKENKKVVSYIEQIQSNNISYLGLFNKNISFLFCPNDINEKNIDNNKCFGFIFNHCVRCLRHHTHSNKDCKRFYCNPHLDRPVH